MYKYVLILYVTCFPLYILFSRQPDYFDGEITKATIHFKKQSVTGKTQPFALYTLGKEQYFVDADYLFKSFREGEKVEVIYEGSHPQKGAVYSFWGYWLTWGELIFSIILVAAIFFIAITITKNPTAESLIEQLEDKPARKLKYKN